MILTLNGPRVKLKCGLIVELGAFVHYSSVTTSHNNSATALHIWNLCKSAIFDQFPAPLQCLPSQQMIQSDAQRFSPWPFSTNKTLLCNHCSSLLVSTHGNLILSCGYKITFLSTSR